MIAPTRRRLVLTTLALIALSVVALGALWVAASEGRARHSGRTMHHRGRKTKSNHAAQRAPAAAAIAPETNPFAGRALWVNPNTSAARQASQWRSSRPADADQIDKIATHAQATWLGDWSNGGDVAEIVDAAAGAGQLPVLVVYNLPNLDCGGYSGGGASAAAAYRSWIDSMAAGIGGHPAAVIVEPDALAELNCLSVSRQQTYYDLISYAVGTLAAKRGTAVYIDAGNSNWQPASVMAQRLRQAGIGQARGFSLNVSNFNTTANETAYGHKLSAALGGKPFVIDTSRNGLGPAPDSAWCNPPGRALGQPPTGQTGDPLVDAYLWIKPPGESDGSCNGAPAAGVWWPDYALGLARRATFSAPNRGAAPRPKGHHRRPRHRPHGRATPRHR
jgi:endoglucanase